VDDRRDTVLEDERLRTAERMAWASREANDAIFLFSADGAIRDCNAAAERRYGYSRAELLALNAGDLRARANGEAPSSQAEITQVLTQGNSVFECTHRRMDGASFPVEVSARAARFDSTAYVLAIVRDVSERKAIEAQAARLAATRERMLRDWHLQFDSMPLGCIIVDAQMRTTRYNPAFARTFGVDEKSGDVDLLAQIVPEDIRGGLVAWLRSLRDVREPAIGINENLRLDGTRITCRWTNIPLHDEEGSFVGVMCICEDITEAQSAQRALAASEARFRTLFEQASDAILAFDGSGRIVDTNPEAVRMFGHAQEHLLGLTLDRLCLYTRPDPDTTTVGPVQRERWRMVRADGEELDADVSLRALDDGTHIASIRNESGLHAARRRIEWQRNLYDLLSRCAGEVARLESKQSMYDAVTRIAVEHGRFRFAWVGEVQPDGSVSKAARYGNDGGYVDRVSVSAFEHLPSGMGPTGRAIRSNSTQVANDFRTDPLTEPWRALARATGVGASAAIPLRVGGIATAALMVYADEPGFFNDEMVQTLEQVGAELSAGLDALETRRRLRESQHLLQTLIDGSPNPILSFGPDQRLTVVNKALGTLLGIDPARAIGRRRTDLFTEAQVARQQAWDDRVLATGEQVLVEERIELADGEHIFLTSKYPLRDTAGRIFGVGNVATEITQLHRIERELQQANSRLEELVLARTQELVVARDRAERADRTKTSFLSTISHELRSPLNAIMGFTDVLRLGMSGPLSSEQDSQLAIVQDASRSMLALINELLDLARIEAGRLALDIDTFEVGGLVERRVQALRPLSEPKGLALEVELPPRPVTISSDANRVGQVVTNLVSNAIKFTTSGGVTVRITQEPAVVSICIADTGPGIAEDDLERVFEPFEQAGDQQRRRDGTGLGLPIARQLARALGGDITVQSPPGEGCRFTLTLPLEPPTTQTGTVLQSSSPAPVTS
jgi:PAS domain S-box-containing protein